MSFPTYGSYKDSGSQRLGQVPAPWDLRRIRNVARLNPSKSEAIAVGADTELSFLPMEAIGERGELDLSRTRPLGEVQQGYSFFADGDVVFAKVTPCFENGKGAVMRDLTLGFGFGTTELTVVRPSDPATASFLWWFTYSRAFRDPASAEMVGAGGLKRVPDDYVSDCVIPWPSLGEQQAIAAFLDRETAKIDALVEAQRRLIELLKEKRQAVISHAVTKGLDPSAPMKDTGLGWPTEVPVHWQVLPLTRVVSQFVDYRGATPHKVDEGVPLITATQIKNGKINHELDPVFISEAEYAERMTRGLPKRGDLLLTTEAPLGEVALIEDERVAPGQRIILMKVDKARITSTYLLNHYRSQFGQQELWTRASGSTASGIRSDRLRAGAVLVPPLDEQHAIVAHIVRTTASYSAIEAAADAQVQLLVERRAALISAAVTGKIDVRGLIKTAEAA